VANFRSDDVTVLRNDGGTMTPLGPFPAGDGAYSVALGDVTGDGRPDVVTGDVIGHSVSVLAGTGAASFGQAITYPAGQGTFGVTLADLDGDGDLDVASANSQGQGIAVLLNTETGAFAAAQAFAAGDQSTSIAAGDFNQDGYTDLAVANYGTNDVSVLRNRTGTYSLTLVSGSQATDVDFGNASLSTVVARHIFYNNSAFDGNNPAASASDDVAIAPDKHALLPGGTAGFAHYTSYSRGINGLIVDIAGPHGAITAADFSFRIGNNNAPGTWSPAPLPSSITVRSGAGAGGSDRVTLIWPDGAISKTWLQVTVRPTPHTGLAAADVFYFGNAVGEVGNSSANAIVSSADEALIRLNPRNAFNPAPITFAYDINRDKQVTAADAALSRVNQTTAFSALRLIAPPASAMETSAVALSHRQSALDAALAGISFNATTDDSVQSQAVSAVRGRTRRRV
jgi:hypothetical protein